MQVASPTDRHSISFERFCDMVEFGRLGKLKPNFKSKVVPKGEEFNINVHITEAKVTLRSNSEYFRLDDVS